MEQEQSDIILNIEVKYEEAIKGISDYSQKIISLQAEQGKLKQTFKDAQQAFKEGKIDQEALTKATNDYSESMAASKIAIEQNKTAIKALETEVKNNLTYEKAQAGSLQQLRKELSLNTAAYAKLSADERDNTIQGQALREQIAKTTAELKKQEEALGDHRRSVGDYEKANRSLKSELKDYITQLAEMKIAGQENSDAYKDLVQKAGALKDAIADSSTAVKNAASDTGKLDGAMQQLNAGIGIYTAFAAGAKVFGFENKALVETMQKVQALMAALNARKVIQEAVQKQSAASLLYENIQRNISSKAIMQQVAAQGMMNVVNSKSNIITKGLTLVQILWNKAIMANPVMAIAVAIAALIAILVALSTAFSASAKASKEAEKANADYEKQAIQTSITINNINIQHAETVNKINNRTGAEK
jgi:chromosome segregation ATPase